MTNQADDERASLVDVLDGKAVPFSVDGTTFLIRQPTTEEYDDAIALQNLVIRKTLALPEVRALKDVPCSDAERLTYEAMIAAADMRFHEAEDGSLEKDALAEQIARLQRTIANRTLADETASERGVLARDRWLTMRLLCDEHGKPLFDTASPHVGAAWEALPMRIKNEARPAVWRVLGMVRDAPFSWEALRGPR